MKSLKRFIRDVPNFPKEGIVFKDISPLLANPVAFRAVITSLAEQWDGKIDAIAALDARGFIFGAALALQMGVPLGLVRKKGKLPGKAVSVSYALEYGAGVVELQEDAFGAADRVLVVDDLLATGGTAAAACQLVERVGAKVAGCAFVVELLELGGRDKLKGFHVTSLLEY
jgi:adenine phosphoribosyltransferase